MEVLPESMEEFARVVMRGLGIVRDLKHMARFCEGLEDGKLGLERLGKLLDQRRYGMKHNAGSDSLLTVSTHLEMMQRFDMDSEICDGFLYMAMKMFNPQKVITFGQIPYVIPFYCYAPSSYITYY